MGDGVSMEKIRNLSLKKTMVLYTILSLIVTFFLSVSIIEIAGQIQEEVWWKYVDQDEYYQAMNDRNENFEVVVPRPNQSKMSRMDWHISETCDFLRTYGVLLFSFAGCGIAVSLFYKNKLKRPIQELKMASQMIAEEDLDFHMAYENEDEMGMLCREFERMRGQLEENNRRLWQMIEDERVLRAAIAHDIRSPLAIMRGYQEMLLEFVPEDMLDQEKMMEMLRGGMLQIERMNHFIDSMRKMTKLEERELNCSVVDIRQLINQIEALAEVVVEKSEKNFTVTTVRESEILTADEEIIMEVADNLLANAFRYANQEVRLKLTVTPQYLKMSIRDDGIGFQENIDRVTQAFYHENPQDDLKHFGMGMYISRIYCERHGGKLLIKNVADGGAEVEAVFLLAFLFFQDMRKNTYELLHTKPMTAFQYIAGKISSGFLIMTAALVIMNIVFIILCYATAVKSGFAMNILDFVQNSILYVLPNILMICCVYAVTALLFKNPLPAVPALVLYIIYSNMLTWDSKGQCHARPFSIMVRFPGNFFETELPHQVYLNQLLLVAASISGIADRVGMAGKSNLSGWCIFLFRRNFHRGRF